MSATHLVLRVLSVLAFLLVWVLRAGYPPVADEVDFVKPLAHWIQSGPRPEGLWHAPFYPWLLMFLGRLSGSALWAARLVGAFSVLVTAWCVLSGVKKSRPQTDDRTVTLLYLLLFLSPVFVSSSLLLDYDNTLLMAATALFMRGLLLGSSLPYMTLALGLCFMGKETTPLVYPLGIVFALAPRMGKVKAFGMGCLVAVGGILVFLIPTAVWCRFYGIALARVFDMDLLGLQIHGVAAPVLSWGRKLWVASTPWIWFGLPALGASLIATRRTLRTHAPLWSVIFAVVFTYTFLLGQKTYHFPKYMAPVFPWILALTVMSLNPRDWPEKLKRTRLFWTAGIVAAWFLFNPDPLMLIAERNLNMAVVSVLIVGAPIAILSSLRDLRVGWIAALLITQLGMFIPYLRTAVMTDRSLTYWYGDTALVQAKEITSKIRETSPSTNIISPVKDIAWATGATYIAHDPLLGKTPEVCASRAAIFTRDREEPSLTKTPQLAALRDCLDEILTQEGLTVGRKY